MRHCETLFNLNLSDYLHEQELEKYVFQTF